MEQVALIIATAALVVVTPVWVFTLLEIRRTAAEARKMLTEVRGDLIPLIHEMRQTTEQSGALIGEIRQGFQRTSAFWGVVGDVGESARRVQAFVRNTGSWLGHVFGGTETVTAQKRGHTNGEHS